MGDELTEEELAQMQVRADAATAGPWEAFVEGRDHTGGDDFIRTGGLDDSCPDSYLRQDLGASELRVSSADLDFVACARQDVPRLIEEVHRLRGELIGDKPR